MNIKLQGVGYSLFLVISLLGLIVGVYLVGQKTGFLTKATPTETPQEIKITNISDNSFSVAWITPNKATGGFVKYGSTDNNLKTAVADDRDRGEQKERFTHHVTLTHLEPDTLYPFKIISGGQIFDDNGKPFKQKTAPTTQDTPPVPDPIVGKVVNKDGQGPNEAVVYLKVGDESLLSSFTKEGRWLIDLSNSRKRDFSSYLKVNKEDSLNIEIQAGPDGSVQKTVKADKSNLGTSTLKSGYVNYSTSIKDLNNDGVVNSMDWILLMRKNLGL